MDDLVPECKKKLARFRLPELKEVLGHVGVAKTGRKQDLMERILALLSGEEGSHGPQKKKIIKKEDVAKTIDDVYKKMLFIGENEPVTGGHSISDSSSITPKDEFLDQKVRCPCGISFKTESMIQCADPKCHVLQHNSCVIMIPTEGAPRASLPHYCEICRINRGDPFWKTLAHPLYPVKLLVTSTPDDGSQALQKLESNFQVTKADVQFLENAGHDIQAWCILLNDSVPFRMQWPQFPDLRVNGCPVKTINRPGSKMLGANGRDDGPSIAMYLIDGCNNISLTCTDDRTFCLGVRLVKQRTVQQVMKLIPSEEEGESFTEAVARVCRCMGGGMDAANDDSDSDLEVIADNVTINLRCPMGGCRMKTAARFKGCVHLGCFDLHTLVQINQRSRKWQCPICLKNYSLEDITIDPYLNRIVNMMQSCDEDVTEIDVKSDGSWRAKIARPYMDLEKWHLSDGSLSVSLNKINENTKIPAVKSEQQLPNGNGIKSEEHTGQEVISMSSGSSDEMDYESADHDNMMDSTPHNHNPPSGITNRSSSSSLAEPSVIVLSDSDDEISETMPDVVNHKFQLEDVVVPAGESSKSKQCGPFKFPRQPRTIRRQKDVPTDQKVSE